jgi:hypothetical protein
MTTDERDEIHMLALKIEQYHGEVRMMMEQITHIGREVDNHDKVLYGIPGDDKAPGVLLQIQTLIQSKKALMWGLQAIGGLLMLLLGSVFHKFFGQQ